MQRNCRQKSHAWAPLRGQPNCKDYQFVALENVVDNIITRLGK
jgi:hypothetical protein